MAELFNVTLESGNLTGTDDSFTLVVDDGGDLLNHADAKLAGSARGLLINIDDANAVYGEKDTSPGGSDLRERVYFDPNALTMANNDNFIMWIVLAGASYVMDVKLAFAGGNYRLIARAWKDDATSVEIVSWDVISDAEHMLEAYVEQASSDVAADGRVRMWLDGAAAGDSGAVLDNFDIFNAIDHTRIGAVVGIDAGTDGPFYMDELKANDDGSEIGARVAAPIMMYDYRRRRV